MIFNNSVNAKKIDELINEWHNAIIQYANMYAKIERFVRISIKLPEKLKKKTAKEAITNKSIKFIKKNKTF